jgi:hypothetical protein
MDLQLAQLCKDGQERRRSLIFLKVHAKAGGTPELGLCVATRKAADAIERIQARHIPHWSSARQVDIVNVHGLTILKKRVDVLVAPLTRIAHAETARSYNLTHLPICEYLIGAHCLQEPDEIARSGRQHAGTRHGSRSAGRIRYRQHTILMPRRRDGLKFLQGGHPTDGHRGRACLFARVFQIRSEVP